MTFAQGYKQLNKEQRQAVDTIDGPVLVVAGPGTGKTQLLSMRAANIVRITDAAPGNILCLTFTDSAAAAMRERLVSLMGPDGNKVAVQTFHSFGTDIINRYPEYFYNGARFSPADKLTGYEVLRDIFEELPHSSPLAKTMNDEFTYLRDAQNAISHLKRAGLLPQELLAVLDHNQQFCDQAEPLLQTAFASPRLSKQSFPAIAAFAEKLQALEIPPPPLPLVKPLAMLFIRELLTALQTAQETGKTTSLTAWRNRWAEKNHLNELVFKERRRVKKLRALADIYTKYRQALLEEELFDFDDMIGNVAHTLETTPELCFNLQEQFLYVMVDEFQDTNGAQMRLLAALTDNPVHEARPNILAVGDDDQAIYAFQGADLSNILDFKHRYRDPAIITLTENYRSTAPVLQHARSIITQAEQRLETSLEGINKTLHANNTAVPSTVQEHQFATPQTQYEWIAQQVAEKLKQNKTKDIAVLARHHKQLMELLPYLHDAGVRVKYERRNNALESPHVHQLVTLAKTVVYLGEQRFDLVESLLPQLLSYPFWGLSTADLWNLSLNSYKQRRMWLELMIDDTGKLRRIAEFLALSAHQANRESYETLLDTLIGNNELQVSQDGTQGEPGDTPRLLDEQFISPYRAYYFNEQRFKERPAEYLTLLSNLQAVRTALRAHHPEHIVSLRNFIDFIELHEHTQTEIVDHAPHPEDTAGVTLMTAHKAKGLEFNTVFVMSAQDEIWGRRVRRPASSLSFPYNLPIEPVGGAYDEALRLFFVAVTRAKQHLFLTHYQTSNANKPSVAAEFLQIETAAIEKLTHDTPLQRRLDILEPGWEQRHLHLPHIDRDLLLRPALDTYRLSPTHLNNFLNVTRGGPQAFLLQNLLRFPQAISPAQAFGQAVHAVLARAHTHLSATGEPRPVEDILHDFELQLQKSRLSEREFSYLLEKGSDVLQTYLTHRYQTFAPSQKAERSFANQHIVVDGVRLTGIIDLMQVDPVTKTIVITDYKTGKGHETWRAKTAYENVKLHQYKQQLIFYKLLIEHAPEFAGYQVERGVLEFVEPDGDGQLHQLELIFTPQEVAAVTAIIKAVWNKIQNLDFPDTSHYSPDLKGVLAFEQDLLSS